MTTQRDAGKAFEYALLIELFELLKNNQLVTIIRDKSFNDAHICFEKFILNEQQKFRIASVSALKHLINLEPRLQYPLSDNDKLELLIVADKIGIAGDVRDVLAIRSKHNWEIGISAKNHHEAVKHSRLSGTIDFGKQWLNIACSQQYSNRVGIIFQELSELKKQNLLWREVENKSDRYYLTNLRAFRDELIALDRSKPNLVPERLLHYLIGKKDFYKVIKRHNITTIQAFNIAGTLNVPANRIKPKIKIPRLKLPKRIIEISFKPNSKNTLIVTCDEGWQISFRIHSASSKVETSLKFDIKLIGHPPTLYSNQIIW